MDPAEESRIAVLWLNKPTRISALRFGMCSKPITSYSDKIILFFA